MIDRDIDLTEKLDFNKDKKLLPMKSNGSSFLQSKDVKKKNKDEIDSYRNTWFSNNYTTNSTSNIATYYSNGYSTHINYGYNGNLYVYHNVISYDRSTYYYNNFDTANYTSWTTTNSYNNIRVDDNGNNLNITYTFNVRKKPKTNDEKVKELFERYKDYSNCSLAIIDISRNRDINMKSSKTFVKKLKDRLNDIYHLSRRKECFENRIPWGNKETEEYQNRKIPWLRRLSSWNYKDYINELKGDTVNYMEYLNSNWYHPNRTGHISI